MKSRVREMGARLFLSESMRSKEPWLKVHPRTERMALIVQTYSRVNTILASAVLRVRKASQEAIRSFGD